jgi:superfamily II DNA or RNA helicase
MEVVKIGEHFNFPVEITGLERIVDYSFDKEHFKQFCEDFFVDSTFKPRDYQIESAAEILKYRLCSSEIATSAGKTFIVFIIYAYLKSMGKLNKIAIIVPNTTLVMQLKDDWEEYNDGKLKMKVRQVYGGSKDRESDADVIVGTFQSLCKKTLDYYKGVDVVFCDEAHQSSTASVKNVVSKCKDSIYRFGLSGTIKEDDSADFATVTSLLGPLVKTISPKFLFKEGYATPAKFKIIVLKYNDDICEKLSKIKRSKQLEGSQLLAFEKEIVIKNPARFKFITDLVNKSTKNSMVLFSNVKDQYGKKIYEHLKEHSNKQCFYVDGSVNQDNRNYFKKEMEVGTNKTLIASFNTFSTGISIKNVHNIIFIESYKSEIIIKQSIGRGMRQLEGKEDFTIIDIVDDISWQGRDNYLYKHGKARLEMYKEYTNDIKIHRINL